MDCDDLWPVLLLLARGADPLVRTNAGDRASDYAKLQRNKEVASLLLEAESHVNPIQFAHNHPALPKHMLPKVIKENYHLSAAFLAGLEDEESDEKFQAPPIAHRTNQSLSSAEDSWEGGASITEDAAKEQAIEPESTRFTLRDLTQTTDNSEELQQPEQEECLATRIGKLRLFSSYTAHFQVSRSLSVRLLITTCVCPSIHSRQRPYLQRKVRQRTGNHIQGCVWYRGPKPPSRKSNSNLSVKKRLRGLSPH